MLSSQFACCSSVAGSLYVLITMNVSFALSWANGKAVLHSVNLLFVCPGIGQRCNVCNRTEQLPQQNGGRRDVGWWNCVVGSCAPVCHANWDHVTWWVHLFRLQLLLSIKQPEFIVTLHVVAKVFAINLPLCRQLQTPNIDLANAMKLAKDVEELIREMRVNAVNVFSSMFAAVTTLCQYLDVELLMPRLSKRQTNRCNVQTDSIEDYFRISVFVPFLDSFCVQLHDRLVAHNNILSSFMCLLPQWPRSTTSVAAARRPCDKQIAEMSCLVDTYAADLSCNKDAAFGELEMWYRQLSSQDQIPHHALDAFLFCDGNAFPTVKKLLQILATLPVTTCSSERSFSTLRRLKTYLRNTIGSNRLNGLALLNVHRDITVSAGEVLDELAKKPRRLPFRLA